MPLITLLKPIPSFANAHRRFEGRAIVYDPRLFVMSPSLIRFHPSTVSEVLAYQFAEFIGMPLLPYRGFWCPEPVMLRRKFSNPGRIGLALAWDSAPVITGGWCNRAHRYPNTIAKALVLSALRFGYDVRMATTRKRKYVAFDLGGLFPLFDSEWAPEPWSSDELVDDFAVSIGLFQRHSVPKLDSVLRDARRFGLAGRFARIVERVVDAPYWALEQCFDLSPHPAAEEIRTAAAFAVREQFSLVNALV